ncbi:MAG: DUF115 domain-containing protein, partial [Spirochaetaceae bacterium]|nr:DUF115 domain-containing protein [Spirochaetaceae bacterium]
MGFMWDKNSAVISARFPGLLERLSAGAEGGDIQTETAASGAPTLTVKGLYVHSPRDPEREAARLAEALTGAGPLVLLGFGLGYAAEAASAKAGERPLIIVEPHGAFLKKALEVRDLRPLFSQRELIFVLGGPGEGIIGALQHCQRRFPGEPAVIRNRALIKLDEPWYAEVERCLGVWIAKNKINSATLKRFGARWVRNLSRNLAAIRDVPGINLLRGALPPDIPVFLAAAGPSLDQVRRFLPAIRERCAVLAVDTALSFVLESGADPDFALSVDPQYWNSRHLDRADAPNTALIAESAVYPSVLRHKFARVFLCGSLFPLGAFIEERLDPKGRLGAGGSVATTAWDFAGVLGTGEVWVAGLDLGFPQYKTHFKGAFFEARALSESSRLNPLETWSVKALRSGGPLYRPSAAGGAVLTDQRLSLYAAWFETRFQQAAGIRTFRLGAEGLALAGSCNASVEELLALPARRGEIDRRLGAAFAGADAARRAPDTLRNRQYEKAVQELLAGLDGIKAQAQKAAALSERAYTRCGKGRKGLPDKEREKLLRKLEEADRRIRMSAVKDVAGFLFPPLEELETALESSEAEPLRRYFELSARLYRALAKAAGYNLSV